MASLLMAIRRFRDGRAAVLGLVLLVLVTAVCAALTPRLLDRLADGAVRGEFARADPFERNIQLVQERIYEASSGPDPLAGVVMEGRELEAQMPAGLRALFRDRSYVVQGLRWTVLNETTDPGFVRMRIQQDAGDHIRYVEGRPPTGTTRQIVIAREPPEEDVEITVLEVALSVETLERIGLKVGDTWMLRPDATDRLVGRGGLPQDGAIDVVGAFEPIDEASEYWLDDTALIRPSFRQTPNYDLVDMTALVAPEAYTALLSATSINHFPFRYTWRYFVDQDRLESERVGSLVRDLRRLEGTFGSTGGVGIEGGTALGSGLLALLEAEQARWTSAAAVLAVVGLGPAAVGIAALALIGLFVMQRRRPGLALGRARGASSGQLISAVAIEGLVISLPPAFVAGAVAFLLIPTGPRLLTIAGAAVVAAITTILLVGAGAPTAIAPPRGPGRDQPIIRRPSPRRLAFEALIVGLAIAGAYLLRERGVRGASSTTELAGADPFIAVVPALTGIAAGIVAVRLLPLPMAILSRLAAFRRDLVPVLALRRVTRGGTGGPVLIVLMAMATIGTFAGTTLLHLDRAADAVAWREIGAPYRLAAPGPLPRDLEPTSWPGVTIAAAQTELSAVVQTRFLPLQLIAIEAANYQQVVSGTGAVGLPREMLAPAAEQPLPAIISPHLTTGTGAITIGGTVGLSIEGYGVKFRVVEVRESFPGLPPNQPFLIASRDQLRALRSGAGLNRDTAMYLRAPDDAAAGIREALRHDAGHAVLVSRTERTSAIQTAPIVRALVSGVAAAAIVAFVYAALAVSAALALAGAARAIEVAHLRTLGLTRREALGLVVVEHGPTIVVAFVAGAALGIGLFALLREALGLGALVGSDVEVAIAVEPLQLAGVLIAIVIIVGLGIGLGAALQRGAAPAAAVRRGFE
ncbi:MAG TPA: FtsX-like permease family protein [Candidatus Limnocylindrales bacterium]|nr:FtsX-like permease family protein [Candidatus Limnocylindrales bacterium]